LQITMINQSCKFRSKDNSNRMNQLTSNPTKGLKKNSFRSSKFRSKSSKLWAFHSLQIQHIKQWGTTFQAIPYLWQPNHHSQEASKSTTVFGMQVNLQQSLAWSVQFEQTKHHRPHLHSNRTVK